MAANSVSQLASQLQQKIVFLLGAKQFRFESDSFLVLPVPPRALKFISSEFTTGDTFSVVPPKLGTFATETRSYRAGVKEGVDRFQLTRSSDGQVFQVVIVIGQTPDPRTPLAINATELSNFPVTREVALELCAMFEELSNFRAQLDAAAVPRAGLEAWQRRMTNWLREKGLAQLAAMVEASEVIRASANEIPHPVPELRSDSPIFMEMDKQNLSQFDLDMERRSAISAAAANVAGLQRRDRQKGTGIRTERKMHVPPGPKPSGDSLKDFGLREYAKARPRMQIPATSPSAGPAPAARMSLRDKAWARIRAQLSFIRRRDELLRQRMEEDEPQPDLQEFDDYVGVPNSPEAESTSFYATTGGVSPNGYPQTRAPGFLPMQPQWASSVNQDQADQDTQDTQDTQEQKRARHRYNGGTGVRAFTSARITGYLDGTITIPPSRCCSGIEGWPQVELIDLNLIAHHEFLVVYNGPPLLLDDAIYLDRAKWSFRRSDLFNGILHVEMRCNTIKHLSKSVSMVCGYHAPVKLVSDRRQLHASRYVVSYRYVPDGRHTYGLASDTISCSMLSASIAGPSIRAGRVKTSRPAFVVPPLPPAPQLKGDLTDAQAMQLKQMHQLQQIQQLQHTQQQLAATAAHMMGFQQPHMMQMVQRAPMSQQQQPQHQHQPSARDVQQAVVPAGSQQPIQYVITQPQFAQYGLFFWDNGNGNSSSSAVKEG